MFKSCFKKFLIGIVCVFVFVSALSIPAFADSASIALSGSSVNVGSTVTVTVNYKAGYAMYAVDGSLTYNSAVLQYVSGGGAHSGSTVKMVDTFSGETSASYKIVFKAIAAGSSNLSLKMSGSGAGDGSATAGATVNVVTPKPSDNANLASLKLSDGALSPAFSAGKTSYTATVKYPVEQITISAAVADGKATCVGAGTFKLKVGDNTQTITVTAPSGAKKSYTVTIKRLNEEETAALIAEERAANPTLVVVDGKDYNIVPDISAVPVPLGFVAATVERKGAEVGVLRDESGKYELYYVVDENGENGDFYTKDEQDNFTRLVYISANGKLYIPQENADLALPAGYVSTELELAGGKVLAYQSDKEGLKDFYIVNCYCEGKEAFYRYDSVENTMQRATDFELLFIEEEAKGFWASLMALSVTAKIIIALSIVVVVAIVVIIVLLIVKIVKSSRSEYVEDDEDEEILSSFEIEEQAEETQESAEVNEI